MTAVLKAFDDDARAEVVLSIFDAETQTVCTTESKQDKDHCASFEAAAWKVDMTMAHPSILEERPTSNAVVSFNFEDGASVGTIHQGTTPAPSDDEDEQPAPNLPTQRPTDEIKRRRTENELIAQVAALKRQLERHTVQQSLPSDPASENSESDTDTPSDQPTTPASPGANQEAGTE